MENEMSNVIKVWLSVIVSLCYSYVLGTAVSKGTKRLFWLLPVVCLFLYLPLHLGIVLLRGPTAFYIAWLANFKLLLFAFGMGPLCPDASVSLLDFLALACLPIKIQGKSSQKHQQNVPNGNKSPLNFAIKGLLFALLVRVYAYKDHIHPLIMPFLYCLLVYVALETMLAAAAILVRLFLGLELEPQFNEPYLSTSLQEFWGRRWNLMVPSILRLAVYRPVRNMAALAVGKQWASAAAVMTTFLVSAVMHDLIFFYLGRLKPTWEVTCFFLLHGFCVTLELALKKKFAGRLQLPWLISGPLTIGFVMVTSFWLFLPRLHSSKVFETAFMEYGEFVTVMEDAIHRIRIYAVGML